MISKILTGEIKKVLQQLKTKDHAEVAGPLQQLLLQNHSQLFKNKLNNYSLNNNLLIAQLVTEITDVAEEKNNMLSNISKTKELLQALITLMLPEIKLANQMEEPSKFKATNIFQPVVNYKKLYQSSQLMSELMLLIGHYINQEFSKIAINQLTMLF